MALLGENVLVFCLAFINTCVGSPILKLPSPVYYVNQTITISCDSALIGLSPLSIAIAIDTSEVECRKVSGVYKLIKGANDLSVNCQNLPPTGNVNLAVTTLLAEKFRSSTVTCTVSRYNATLDSLTQLTDTKMQAFSDAFVAPTRLEFDKFEFDVGVPVLNRHASTRCKSSDSIPPSEYFYEVRNKEEVLVYNITMVKDGVAEFVINDSLKNGFKVTCRDKMHTRGEISLTKQDCGGTGSELCRPRYISPKVSISQNISYNPSFSNSLKCEVEGYPTDEITYSWTSNGIVVPAAISATYIITANTSKTGFPETVSCTASLDKYGSVTIAWNITWSLQATTTTEAPDPGTSSVSSAIGVGVGVGLAVVIIVIVVGVVLYKKKTDSSARYQNTPPASNSVTVSKPEKPKKPSSQTTNGGYPAYSKPDDHHIYTELIQCTLGIKQPHPAKLNPKCSKEVLHVKIHPDKTRQLTNSLTNYYSFAKMLLFFIHSLNFNL